MSQLFRKDAVTLANGATGSELQKRGLSGGVCPSLWVLEHPQAYEELVRAYLDAGAAFIATPTFGANPVELAHHGLEHRCEEINEACARLARRAAGRAPVAAEMGPTGVLLQPLGELSFEDAVAAYVRQVTGLLRGQPDFFLLETFSDPQEARAAVLAIRQCCDLPFAVSFTFQNGRTMTGATPEAAAVIFTALGAAAVGCNCSGGPASLAPIVRAMAAHTVLPIMAKPNAGLPQSVDGRAVYPMPPQDFARDTAALVQAGATILGGCCGATPEHIAALGAALGGKPAPATGGSGALLLASARQVAAIDVGAPLCLVGERINPSGKPALTESLLAGRTDEAVELAQSQLHAGVHALDVNVGAGGVDETAMLCAIIRELALRADAPLFLDTANPDAMEAALRLNCGCAACNSIAAGPNTDRLLALCRHYGAVPVLMPLDGWHLPDTAAGRWALLDGLLHQAAYHGFGPADVLVDCGTPCLAMGANTRGAVEFVAQLREKGIRTVAGVSNVSYRLPARDNLNCAYLAQLTGAGLCAALINPTAAMMNMASAGDAVRGADEYAMGYIQRMRGK